MPDHQIGADKRLASFAAASLESTRHAYQQRAQALLNAYNNGDPQTVEKFHTAIPNAKQPGYTPTLLHARLLVASSRTIPKRLSLEKLKKEAKDLLKQLEDDSPDALMRLEEHRSTSKSNIKLADAQFIIARENGLSSWAKLKRHIELMTRASEQIAQGHMSPDNDYKTLHIRCGNDIKDALQTCGFTGDFLEVSNPFPQGPVPHFEPLNEFVKVRTKYLKENYSEYAPQDRIQNTESEIRHVEDMLFNADKRYQRIVLWYEHDSFDQLSKAYVLAHLSKLTLKETIVECIQIEGFPGVSKFIGIGQLSRMPEAILTLWAQRQPVTQTMIAHGAKCWNAFTNNSPLDLWALSQEAEPPLEQMPIALKRTLMELPCIENGLSLTEYLSLDILAREEAMTPGAIFNLLMTESDPLPFHGDIMLLLVLRPLWEGDQPAIKVVEELAEEHPMRQVLLSITDLGRSLLAGEINWLTLHKETSSIDRHVGGVHITSSGRNWYWNPELNKPEFKSL